MSLKNEAKTKENGEKKKEKDTKKKRKKKREKEREPRIKQNSVIENKSRRKKDLSAASLL